MSAPETPLNIASLLRSAADGELTAEQQQVLDAHLASHPQDQACVAFERSLREAVARSMQSEKTPADLADRIRSAIHDSATDVASQDDTPLVETIASSTRTYSFWSSAGRRLAIAAALILVVSGGWFAYSQVTVVTGENWRNEGNRFYLANFLGDQHMNCSDPQIAGRKFTVSEVDEIDGCCVRIIKKAPELEKLFDDGGKLIGLGKCGVPGPGKSVHMQVLMPVMQGNSGMMAPPSTVSLFIQQALDREGIDPETSYSLAEAKKEGYEVDVWKRDGLIYYLVCDSPEASEAARKALKVSTPNQSL